MQSPQVVTLMWLLLIAVVIGAVGWIFLHWFALGLTVGSAAANQFLLRAFAVAATAAAAGGAAWFWWRKSQKTEP